MADEEKVADGIVVGYEHRYGSITNKAAFRDAITAALIAAGEKARREENEACAKHHDNAILRIGEAREAIPISSDAKISVPAASFGAHAIQIHKQSANAIRARSVRSHIASLLQDMGG